MASNTPNLNLYKKDPVVDSNDTFNITTMLNDNWDKIDQGYQDNSNKIDALAGEGNTATVKAVDDALKSHKSDTAASAHKDKNIAVVDANNHFTGTTLNAVLDELFTFADNGRKGIVSVVGSPATNSDSFDTLKSRIQTDKNTLATNLTNKGQTSAGAETLAALVSKVVNINTGRKWASGTAISTQITSYVVGIAVSGLGFKPNIIICYSLVGTSMFYVGFYCADISTVACYYYKLPKAGNQSAGNGCYSLVLGTTTGDDYYVINGAFKIGTNSTSDSTGGNTFNWIAIE